MKRPNQLTRRYVHQDLLSRYQNNRAADQLAFQLAFQSLLHYPRAGSHVCYCQDCS